MYIHIHLEYGPRPAIYIYNVYIYIHNISEGRPKPIYLCGSVQTLTFILLPGHLNLSTLSPHVPKPFKLL